MPMRPPLACSQSGCTGIAEPKTAYCKNHAKKPLEMARERDADRRRRNPWRKWYKQKGWLNNLQPDCLARHPLCQLMITPLCRQHGGDGSEVADHIIPHRGDPALFFDPKNLQGACVPCHNAKREAQAGNLPPIAPIGEAGKIFTTTSDPDALKAAMAAYDSEDLDDVTIPGPPARSIWDK
jgi:5-methylcytosine-specific restriction protein A